MKDILDEIFVDKHSPEVYTKIDKLNEEQKLSLLEREHKKRRELEKENKELKYYLDNFVILCYKFVEIFLTHNYFDKDFDRLPNDIKLKKLHNLANQLEKKWYQKFSKKKVKK